ncbi:MAG: cytochrome bc complex cytochrome b subunit [Vampirovibrionales bacterium]
MSLPLFKDFNPILFIWDWLCERMPIVAAIKFAAKKEVPVHKHSLWYYMGGVAMLFVIIQFVTGVLLMVHYVPSMDAAYQSVMAINNKIPFGWLIRSMHSWGANLFIFVLFIHMHSTYFMKAYRAPRELTWLTGLGLIFLAMVFGFTGYLLPMDEMAFFASKVGIDIAGSTPIIGDLVALFARGGVEIGQGTINRFFTIHVIALPAALMGLLGLHLTLIQLQGISEPPEIQKLPEKQKKYEKFFPDFFMKDLLVWLVVTVAFLAIVCISPWHLGPQADPAAAAPLGIRPEWYFLSQFQILKLMPQSFLFIEGEHLGLGLIGLAVASLAIVPFIDTGKNPLLSKLATVWGWMFLVGNVILTIWGMY